MTKVDKAFREYVAGLYAGPAYEHFPTPGALACRLRPSTVQTPALRLIDDMLVQAATTPNSRTIITMPPQEGKSQRISRAFPEWLLRRNPDLRVGEASYEATIARRWGRAVRDDIVSRDDVFPFRVRHDLSAQHEWQLSSSEGGMVSVGVGSALTGRPLDALIIDDPVKDRQQADSEAYRRMVWDWYTEVAETRLSPGSFVVLVMTRWHEDDLAGRLLTRDESDWQLLNIPAQAGMLAKTDTEDWEYVADPDHPDPLGRKPGQFLQSARKRTLEEWEAIKTRMGGHSGRTWNALYQGQPSPTAGTLFLRHLWQRYDTPLWIVNDNGQYIIPVVNEYIEVVQSWDMAFKDLDTSDWVVGTVWMKRGPNAYLLDRVRIHADFMATIDAVKELQAKWPQTTAKFIEDKANGTAVINMLRREMSGLIPVVPTESKVARAQAVIPFLHAGNVHLPEPHIAPWIGEFIDEHTSFPYGQKDDQVDSTTQALNRLMLDPLMTQAIVTQDDIDDDLADYRIGADI